MELGLFRKEPGPKSEAGRGCQSRLALCTPLRMELSAGPRCCARPDAACSRKSMRLSHKARQCFQGEVNRPHSERYSAPCPATGFQKEGRVGVRIMERSGGILCYPPGCRTEGLRAGGAFTSFPVCTIHCQMALARFFLARNRSGIKDRSHGRPARLSTRGRIVGEQTLSTRR